MKILILGFYLFLSVLFVSCQSSTTQIIENQTNKDSISCTKLVYTIIYAEGKKLNYANESGMKNCTEIEQPKFIQELRNQHKEKDKIIFFDGHQSLTKEENNDDGFWSNTTMIRDTSSWILYLESLQYVHFWGRYKEAIPAYEERPPAATVTFTKKRKQILSYTCEQVILESWSEKLVCWFTKELQIKEPIKALIQLDSIPGTILEMEEYWVGLNCWQYVKTTQVKSLEQVKVPYNFFEVPKDILKMDSEEAMALNFKRMVEASKKDKPLSAEERNKFLGTWALVMDNYGLQLEIKEVGNNSYEVIETDIENNLLTLTKNGKAAFYGSFFVRYDSHFFVRYKLTSDGKLQEEKNPFYTFSKSLDEDRLLLNSLNYWVKGGGDSEHPIKNMKSTGESNSKVEDLKAKIAEKGLKIKWMNGKYEFEKEK